MWNKNNHEDGIPFNAEEFQAGYQSMSEFCGKIFALVRIGVTPDKAIEYFSAVNDNIAVAENNKTIAEINADASVEVAKINALQDLS